MVMWYVFPNLRWHVHAHVCILIAHRVIGHTGARRILALVEQHSQEPANKAVVEAGQSVSLRLLLQAVTGVGLARVASWLHDGVCTRTLCILRYTRTCTHVRVTAMLA